MNMTTNEVKSLMSESDIRLYQVKEVIRGDLSECIFIFQNRRVFNINGDNFNLFMALGSEWLLIVYPALSTEGKVEAKFLSQDYVDRMPILSRHNLFQLYKKGKGSICLLKGSPSPFSKMQKEEAPAKIIPDIKEIQAAILGGDTNVIRALEGKMKGDFGKALAREIARRLLPPSFEEQMRLDIAELRRAQWRGKSISMKEAVTRMQDCETQLRSAYESGEIDRETYVELMGKLGLDVNKYPNRHLPGPRTKAPTNAAEVH
ncbi:MAG: hypothetical protein LBN38_00485, partial [Verrucomicrobiota bacterium]|jgi:hypothetical protein|nr:hypothetical protein [Verrucomicrobiota bacterium]